MARLPRLTLTDYPHHVILRGNNRQMIFSGESDMQRMLGLLEEHGVAQGVDVHAYVLMANHLHLLLTPRRDGALSLMMQAVGRSYVRAFNQAHGRTGTLWEGRYRSSLIQTERYLLTCMAYIDLNPVRAGLVEAPEDYPWSSHTHYTGRQHQHPDARGGRGARDGNDGHGVHLLRARLCARARDARGGGARGAEQRR
jgi:putative transposase